MTLPRPRSVWVAKRLGKLKQLYGNVRRAAHDLRHLGATLALARQRRVVEDRLRKIALSGDERFTGRVLVDAMFDNPNFWYRWTLLRAALGLAHAEEIGVVGQFNTGKCVRSLKRMGVRSVVQFRDYYPPAAEMRQIARELLAATRCSQDVLEWRLPFDFPAAQAYDRILKWQRGAQVDAADPALEDFLVTCLQQLHAADRLIDQMDFSLVLISQTANFDQGGLAWVAAKRGIPIIVNTGHNGVPRFKKGLAPDRVFAGGDRPPASLLRSLPEERRDRMAAVGQAYLDSRQKGLIAELSAIYAYQRRTAPIDRAGLARQFGWDADKPIVMVYGANWFDYPHAFGMSNFRDFLDWTEVVLRVAVKADHANWLFKAHPTDEWYGGLTLDEVMPKALPPHIGMASRTASSRDLIRSVDALTTVHGTSGLEFVSAGKPVLVADKGWYHDAGFCVAARTRQEYIDLLGTVWWSDVDMAVAQRNCFIFAGWLFACPEWQGNLVCGDDAERTDLYWKLAEMLDSTPRELAREIAEIRRWYGGKVEGYHVDKMREASAYRLANSVSDRGRGS